MSAAKHYRVKDLYGAKEPAERMIEAGVDEKLVEQAME